MSRDKKDSNIEIGERLKAIRLSLSKSQAEIAEILNVSDEHYRKLESGSAGLTIEKVRILYEELNVDPTWIIVGKPVDEFDLEKYLTNCSKKQRYELFTRCWNYISKNLMK